MNIYLIRHADAVTLGQNNVNTDEERPLTEAGQAQTAALAATLQRHGVKLDKIVHSPLVRSEQTAAALARHWSTPAPTLEACDHLAPGGRSKKLLRSLRGLEGEHFALVGHQPDIAAFAAWLIGGKNAQLDISKAGVAAIDFPGGIDKGEGVLKWLITDKWLQK
jgi:phosphohistidine phosphatase